MKNPCHNCPRRFDYCHAVCADYAAWSALHRAAREKDAQQRAADVVNIESCNKAREARRRRIKGR